ncbi:hypothetical protein C2845_PM02G04380 [Panicum miliaceum]|uniref:DUF295 domain-containing protein n=1 Tax=Panicum miliaceum TaxID=4540 RepID=A0A3L6SB33_PANMI|nr:hypothetical protein C2845_PM02G04380 [Panicum miliaceum]
MVYTACAVFLYGGTSDQPLPPLTARRYKTEHGYRSSLRVSEALEPMVRGEGLPWKRVRTTSSGWRAATVANPAAAPAAAFSHVHASAAGGEVPGGISGERWPPPLRFSPRDLGSRDRRAPPDCSGSRCRRGRLRVRGRTAKSALQSFFLLTVWMCPDWAAADSWAEKVSQFGLTMLAGPDREALALPPAAVDAVSRGPRLHPGHGKLGGYVRFFNLSTGAFVRVRLPLFRDHCVLDSVDGILLLQRDQDTAIRLLHPFTGDIAEFPPLETLLPYVNRWLPGNKWCYLRNIGAACISVGADGVVKEQRTDNPPWGFEAVEGEETVATGGSAPRRSPAGLNLALSRRRCLHKRMRSAGAQLLESRHSRAGPQAIGGGRKGRRRPEGSRRRQPMSLGG